jgi:hypothetical protein
MIEEKHDDQSLNNDDISVLNVLMHSIKGISPVSTTANFMPSYDEDEA